MRLNLTRHLGFGMALLAGLAFAQEGHPLSGSWHGNWTATGGQKTPVFIFMKWDSKNITGSINPGAKAAPFKVVTLDPSTWTVHIEADGKDPAGAPVRIVIDGKLENIGSYHRTISGTWMQGSVKGDFKITRD
jgi:hypothetical protein